MVASLTERETDHGWLLLEGQGRGVVRTEDHTGAVELVGSQVRTGRLGPTSPPGP